MSPRPSWAAERRPGTNKIVLRPKRVGKRETGSEGSSNPVSDFLFQPRKPDPTFRPIVAVRSTRIRSGLGCRDLGSPRASIVGALTQREAPSAIESRVLRHAAADQTQRAEGEEAQRRGFGHDVNRADTGERVATVQVAELVEV